MFEEIENKKNHSVAYTILAIFIMIAAVGGVAVAIYNWSFTSQNNNVIGTGNISMTLLESTDVISISDALPDSEVNGKKLGKDKSFDFAVSTSASGSPGNINYNLSITKLSVDAGYTQLNDSDVDIYLTVLDGEEEIPVVSPITIDQVITSGDTGVLSFDSGKTGYLTHAHSTVGVTTTTKYRLRMWIDSNVDASSWTSTTKNQYKLKVGTSGTLVG